MKFYSSNYQDITSESEREYEQYRNVILIFYYRPSTIIPDW